MIDLGDLDRAALNCMKCGFCKAVCPVFTMRETESPRARIRLIKAAARGEIEAEALREQVGRCINCKACEAECPSGVRPGQLVLQARNYFVENEGVPAAKRVIFRNLLPSRRLMAAVSFAMGVAQRLSLISRPQNPLRNLFPMLNLRRNRYIPTFAVRPFLSTVPENLQPFGQRRARVAYFVGCSSNLIYPEIARATVSVLRKLGCEVLLPKDQVCCGTPVFNSGDFEGGLSLAQKNLDIFSGLDVDAIITACGSCGTTLSKEWRELLGLDVPEEFSAKVRDISALAIEMGLPELAAREEMSVTYHDSCHLKRGQEVFTEPREIISTIDGVSFTEMNDPDRCCGGGGAFSLYHPQLSQEIAEPKIEAIAATGANTVVTGCPACVMQLRDALLHRRMPQKVMHTSELLDAALQFQQNSKA